MILSDLVRNRIQYLKQLIEKKAFSLSGAPLGYLEIKPQGQKVYFDYCFTTEEGRKKKYMRVSDPDDQALVRAVAQRDYDKTIVRFAEKELKLLERLDILYEKGEIENVYSMINKARQPLVTPIRLTDEQYADWWQAQELRKAVILPEVTTFETERGEKVRSKSEVFIADTLKRRNRKYHYEVAVTVTDHLTSRKRIVYPDFYVLNPHTRKAYYWEHFGKCDDPGYVNRNLNKLIDYRSVGIIPGVNLIMTFETKQIPFSPKAAEDVIDVFLV